MAVIFSDSSAVLSKTVFASSITTPPLVTLPLTDSTGFAFTTIPDVGTENIKPLVVCIVIGCGVTFIISGIMFSQNSHTGTPDRVLTAGRLQIKQLESTIFFLLNCYKKGRTKTILVRPKTSV